MSSGTSGADAEAGAAATLEEELNSVAAAALVLKLSSLPCVSAVRTRPVQPATKPNHFGVTFDLRLPNAKRQTKRSAVTGPDGDRPTFTTAVQSAIDTVLAALKASGLSDVEAAPAHEAPATAEELDWLASWIDEHAEPDTISFEQAAEALRSRRASTSGAATTTLLMERQLLDAKVCDRRSEPRTARKSAPLHRFGPGFRVRCRAHGARSEAHAKP